MTVLYLSPLTGRVHEARILADLGAGRLALRVAADGRTIEVAPDADPGTDYGQYRLVSERPCG